MSDVVVQYEDGDFVTTVSPISVTSLQEANKLDIELGGQVELPKWRDRKDPTRA